MSRPLIWVLAAAAVIVAVILALTLRGDDDDGGSGETVTAAEWAQNVCGAVGVWRGQMDAIAADVGASADDEAARSGFDRALVETERVVDAIEASGVPDTENGEESAEQVTSWANGAVNDLDQAQGSLDDGATGATATATMQEVVASGRQVLADIAVTDPELAQALQDSGTCQQVQLG